MFRPYFRHFDPLTGSVPDQFSGEFAWIAQEARGLLAGFTREQILERSDLIDRVLRQTAEDRQQEALEALATLLDEGDADFPPDRSGSAPHDIEQCMGRVDLAKIAGGEGTCWSELFAVTALGLIGEACAEVARLHKRPKPPDLDVLLLMTGPLAIEAMEALAKAQLLARLDKVEAGIPERISAAAKEHLSKRGAAASAKRHAKTNDLKNRFVRWYLNNEGSGTFHSKAQAATRFLRDLPPEDRRLLRETNAQRTLLEALRTHLRTAL